MIVVVIVIRASSCWWMTLVPGGGRQARGRISVSCHRHRPSNNHSFDTPADTRLQGRRAVHHLVQIGPCMGAAAGKQRHSQGAR
jgi:hypothetical protein